jgi:hypothetical protein
MHCFNTIALLFSGSAFVQGRVASGKLPVVDLTYAVHQATISVSDASFAPSDRSPDLKTGRRTTLQLLQYPVWRYNSRRI